MVDRHKLFIITLLLAIIMSVPAIKVYTHGTFITVAHTMGATIGINSFLLLAVAFDVLHKTGKSFSFNPTWFNRSYRTTNIALFVFWISLIAAGIIKAKWQMAVNKVPFNEMMLQLKPFFIEFFISGFVLLASLFMIIYPLLKNQFRAMADQSIKTKP